MSRRVFIARFVASIACFAFGVAGVLFLGGRHLAPGIVALFGGWALLLELRLDLQEQRFERELRKLRDADHATCESYRALLLETLRKLAEDA